MIRPSRLQPLHHPIDRTEVGWRTIKAQFTAETTHQFASPAIIWLAARLGAFTGNPSSRFKLTGRDRHSLDIPGLGPTFRRKQFSFTHP
jgi:hypothetical protein